MNTVKESVSLFYKESSSDKQYSATLNEDSNNFTVDFAYGRRGSALLAGTKTASPVPYDKAKKIYDALVKEKTNKGYKPDANSVATVFTAVDGDKKPSGMTPQLLNVITEDEALALLRDDAWGMQEKFDGRRLQVKVNLFDRDNSVIGGNRKGLIVSLPQPLVNELNNIGTCEIDGELVGEKYWVFDCLKMGQKDISSYGYRERYVRLETNIANSKYVEVVKLAIGSKAKYELYTEVKNRNGEGVVFKLLTSPYVAGCPNSGGTQLKYKFYATCTCKVLKINDKRSVVLSMADGKPVGNVTIPPNKNIPEVGDLVEIRYLYAVSSLYQPIYLGVRDDLTEADDRSSLKFKANTDTDEDS